MTVQIDSGAVFAGIAIALVLQAVGFVVAEVRRGEQHRQNGKRLQKIETALGLEDPDDVAFMRAADGRRIEGIIREVLDRLGNGKPGQFVHIGQHENLEKVVVGDHTAIRELRQVSIEHAGQIGTLRRDVDGLMSG